MIHLSFKDRKEAIFSLKRIVLIRCCVYVKHDFIEVSIAEIIPAGKR